MVAKLTQGFWDKTARIILRNRILILLLIVAVTLGLSTQWEYMRFSTSEANLLPDAHPENLQYQQFLSQFGDEGNTIVIAVQDPSMGDPETFNQWNILSRQLEAFPEVDFVLSTENLQLLLRDKEKDEFILKPWLAGDSIAKKADLDSLTTFLFEDLPFYDKLLFNKETQTIRTVVYLDKDLINTSVRKDFVLGDLNTLISNFETESGLDVRVSGMPYIRTMNAQNIIDEIGKFILAALGVTSLIFFFFFRSFRATFISICVVIIGVMWAFGTLGLLRYEITVQTALKPPVIIVIGIPN